MIIDQLKGEPRPRTVILCRDPEVVAARRVVLSAVPAAKLSLGSPLGGHYKASRPLAKVGTLWSVFIEQRPFR